MSNNQKKIILDLKDGSSGVSMKKLVEEGYDMLYMKSVNTSPEDNNAYITVLAFKRGYAVVYNKGTGK